jgi:DNA-binding CsgD family transcriptional regulator
MFTIVRARGQLAQVAPVIERAAGGAGELGSWLPARAILMAEIGDTEGAARALEEARERGLGAFRDRLWRGALVYLAEASALLGDSTLAPELYAAFGAVEDRMMGIGHVVVCCGATDRYRGVLAALLGDVEAADRHLSAAIEAERAQRMAPWIAQTAYEHARVLAAARPGDPRIPLLVGEAVEIADAIGMPVLSARARGLATAPAPEPPDGLSPREVQIVRLLARGLSNRQIGDELVISGHTVANHVRSILAKTGAANRTEVAAYAIRRGLAEA